MQWPTWRVAMHQALYAPPDGFFLRERPRDHFRTSVHTSGQFAKALVQLAADAGLRRVVDIGAGSGEMLLQIDELTDDVELAGVEVAPRPAALPAHVAWHREFPSLRGALVVANEWLDNVPIDVAEIDDAGIPRVVHVNPATGEETPGSPVSGSDAAWVDQWWPVALREPGERVEIGRTRDAAWVDLTRRAVNSLCVAVDYFHERGDRPPYGTLSSFKHGRNVTPIPDGSRDITAHVALDAVAAAGVAAGADSSVLTTQRIMLRALGVTSQTPPRSLATTDPTGYIAALSRTTEAAELLAAEGLGGFGWLIQSFGRDPPESVLAQGPATASPAAVDHVQQA